MKIIKNCKLFNNEIILNRTCKKCGCVFEWNSKIDKNSLYKEWIDYIRYYNFCPCCYSRCIFNRDELKQIPEGNLIIAW